MILAGDVFRRQIGIAAETYFRSLRDALDGKRSGERYFLGQTNGVVLEAHGVLLTGWTR